jgi:hypothetical protein
MFSSMNRPHDEVATTNELRGNIRLETKETRSMLIMPGMSHRYVCESMVKGT